ncbi:alpha/beta fold hydrolase [Nonomuraea phyllanthi]|uniref:alpha/beta fold hydrolase n=1 Tax=Nonomuraea phyllanthi TaxID=2219224 RepID=UPI001293F2AA|nr:alpha/beta hydrolase [Nonomuraea phyllanthi]QFY09146.1 alpha/beta fold hydrolase [Nonomuraea phyllanthi]
MITTVSADGTGVRAYDDGKGPPIVLVHPGLSDGTRCGKMAAILSDRYRVLRPDRRQYRLDLKTGAPVWVEQEVEDVLALVRAVGSPAVLYGHSSGGVVALEALVASPSSFAGAVIFEPAAVIGPPLSGENGEVLTRARAAMAAGRPGKALTIFIRGSVGLPGWQAWAAGAITTLMPRYRRLVPSQLDDLEAMDRLGVRLDAYAGIEVPTVLLGGERSPAHLAERLDAIQRVMPGAERVVLPGLDHGADLKKPGEVARVIRRLAEEVLPGV